MMANSTSLTLLHSERSKLYTILAFLSAIWLKLGELSCTKVTVRLHCIVLHCCFTSTVNI